MRSTYTYFAAVNLHLTRLELGRMTPGLFYDMVQIWNKAHKPQEENTLDD